MPMCNMCTQRFSPQGWISIREKSRKWIHNAKVYRYRGVQHVQGQTVIITQTAKWQGHVRNGGSRRRVGVGVTTRRVHRVRNSNTNTAPAPSVPNVALPLSSLSDNNGLSLDMLNSPVSIDLGVMDPFSTLFPYGNPPLGGEPLGAHIAHGHNAPSGLTPVPVGSAGGGGGGGGYMASAFSVLFLKFFCVASTFLTQ